jgi:hypothetical protein
MRGLSGRKASKAIPKYDGLTHNEIKRIMTDEQNNSTEQVVDIDTLRHLSVPAKREAA